MMSGWEDNAATCWREPFLSSSRTIKGNHPRVRRMKQPGKRCCYSYMLVIFSLISLQMSSYASKKYGSVKPLWGTARLCVGGSSEGLKPGVWGNCLSPAMIYLTLPSPDAQFGPVWVTPQRSCSTEFIHRKKQLVAAETRVVGAEGNSPAANEMKTSVSYAGAPLQPSAEKTAMDVRH